MHESEKFLLDFHRLHPGCTSEAFSKGRSLETGQSSYALLAELGAGQAVLDLGCGDGHLLALLVQEAACASVCGLDFSPEELRRAQSREVEVALVRAKAQALPFESGAFSLVLSHFAFHLMRDPDLLVSEVGRVLRPGGRFAAIVGGGPKAGDAFEVFLDVMLEARGEHQRIPAVGDRQLRSDDGLSEVFSKSEHFGGALQIDSHYMDFGGSFEEVWQRCATVYDLVHFTDEDLRDLRTCFRKELGSRAEQPHISCTMAIRRVIATRRPN